MALSSTEAHIAIAVDAGKVYTLPIGNLEILKPEEDNFELLGGASSLLRQATDLTLWIHSVSAGLGFFPA
jgi:hypothetical protein